MAKIKAEKRQKDQAKKQKISENRKHLANVRVVQKNLVFVVGLSPRLSEADVLRKQEYFGRFGKIHKVVINTSTAYAGNQNQVRLFFARKKRLFIKRSFVSKNRVPAPVLM